VSLGNAGSLHDFGIPNLKLSSAMKDLLAGRVPIRLPSDNPVASLCVQFVSYPVRRHSISQAFPTFWKQPFVRAIFLLSYCRSCIFMGFAITFAS